MFLETTQIFWSFKPIMNQIWEQSGEKQFPPFGYWPFSADLKRIVLGSLVVQGTFLNFHQSVSLCYNNHTLDGQKSNFHWHFKLQNLFICSFVMFLLFSILYPSPCSIFPVMASTWFWGICVTLLLPGLILTVWTCLPSPLTFLTEH